LLPHSSLKGKQTVAPSGVSAAVNHPLSCM